MFFQLILSPTKAVPDITIPESDQSSPPKNPSPTHQNKADNFEQETPKSNKNALNMLRKHSQPNDSNADKSTVRSLF